MTFWLLASLALLLVQIYLAAAFYIPSEDIKNLVGGRDNLAKPGLYAGRAARALANLKENLPFFLTLGILAMIIESADMARAILGAQIFVLARIVYVPLYVFAVSWVRSLAYCVSMFGLILMLMAIL